MARKKSTEYKTKVLLYRQLGEEYGGLSFNTLHNSINKLRSQLSKNITYVVKVDQGIKKRLKSGLMRVKVTNEDVIKFIQDKKNQYYSFIIEPYLDYPKDNERYLSLNLEENGINVLFSSRGGVDVEQNSTGVHKLIYDEKNNDDISKKLKVPASRLESMMKVFKENNFCFLECNPYIVKDSKIIFLDAACEVDDTAVLNLPSGSWQEDDFVYGQNILKTEEENIVTKLSQSSLSSFNLSVLNPNGSIGLLLSGGGASLVIADEFYNLGMVGQLVNYGEYSGNPSRQETIIYTKAVFSLLLKSKSSKKIMVIGGGVANFTDILATFTGIIDGMKGRIDDIKKQKIMFFVRRGGPNQEAGLAMIKSFFDESQIPNQVSGPQLSISQFVENIVWEIK